MEKNTYVDYKYMDSAECQLYILLRTVPYIL